MKRMIGLVALVGILSFTLAGCGRGQRPRAKLTGKVTLDGHRVTIGAVTVYAEDGQGEPGEGQIDKDGNYVVANAPVGKVKIRILKPDRVSGKPATIDPDIATKGVGEGKEKLTAEDLKKAQQASETASDGKKIPTPTGGGEADADRQGQAARYKTIEKMPEHYSDPQRSGLTATVAAKGASQDLVLMTKK